MFKMIKFSKIRDIRFYRYLLPYWKKEIWILFLTGVSFIFGLATPYLTKLIIDKAYINHDLRLFIILVIIGGLVFIVNGIINGFTNYLNRYIRLHIKFALNRQLFKKFQFLSYSFFQDNSTGEHLYKVAYDIEYVANLLADILPQIIFTIPKSLFIFGIILYLDWKMALFSLALMPFLFFAPYFLTKKLKQTLKIWIEDAQRLFRRTQEILVHMQLIKAFGKERSEIKSYITGLINNIRLSIKNAKLEIVGLFTNDFAQRAILGLIIFYGGYQVIKGKMTLGSLSAITLYLGQLSLLESRFAHFSQQISLGLVSSIRLEKILDTQPEFDESLYTKKVVFSDGEIEFENISFGYGQKSVLENLSFCIPGGACVGIAGPSGCGKTTIVNLILRLYQPFRGKISIDGCDIAIIDSKSFYEQIGASLQEPYLWNDTIENNIRYGKDNATFQDVQEAARIAGIDGFINTLQEGYKTIIGENACKISEGQKQRIAIARAVLKKPKILILDEAFASVDAQAEDRIINNIHMTLKNSTIIVISHRLSTINKMDLIYFLSSCNRIEIAKQEELLQQNAQYRNYLAHQLQ